MLLLMLSASSARTFIIFILDIVGRSRIMPLSSSYNPCNRIRYIDLGCCIHLTDLSVTKLASLPQAPENRLVKCSNITDESVYALAQSHRPRHERAAIRAGGQDIETYFPGSSLERVHLSYCTNLTLKVGLFLSYL